MGNKKNILGYEIGAQEGLFDEKTSSKNLVLLSL
jgi:hypothetical protein